MLETPDRRHARGFHHQDLKESYMRLLGLRHAWTRFQNMTYINMVVDHGRRQQKPYNKHKNKHKFTTKKRINTSPSRGKHHKFCWNHKATGYALRRPSPKKKVVPRIRSTRWQLFTPSFAACIGGQEWRNSAIFSKVLGKFQPLDIQTHP